MIFKIIVYFIDGIKAVLGTGFAGMSVAIVISPVLINFLEMNAFQIIEKALTSDVLASTIKIMIYP